MHVIIINEIDTFYTVIFLFFQLPRTRAKNKLALKELEFTAQKK